MQNQVFTLNRLNSLLWILFWVFMLSRAMAAELVFEPATPTVVVGQQLTLSVSGTSGNITWTPSKGQVQGAGYQVTYIAPAQAGLDVVTAFDSDGNVGVVKITVTSKQMTSLENGNWEVFTNRTLITAILPSDDGKTLWVGTNGGLEQRDASTGELVRVFTNLDGLPDNWIRTLESDGSGGLWIGTSVGGLVHCSVSGEWTVYNKDNSDLLYGVSAFLHDGNGELWIGNWDGLAYRNVSGEWTVYTTDNSGLPDNNIAAIESDGNGGLWIVAGEILVEKFRYGYEEKVLERGLVYRSVSGEWTFSKYFDVQPNYNYSSREKKRIDILESDGSGGVWFTQTQPYHNQISYYSVNGEKTVYRTDNSGLPYEYKPDYKIDALESDASGGLWIGTRSGLAYRSISGEWTVYTTDNSNLPDHNIDVLESDASGGLWISTPLVSRIAYRSVSGKWTVYTTNNSGKCNNQMTMAMESLIQLPRKALSLRKDLPGF